MNLDAPQQQLEFVVSDVPGDPIPQFIRAATEVLTTAGRYVATHSEEPSEVDWIFEIGERDVSLTLKRFNGWKRIKDDGKTIFEFTDSRHELALSFWRGLRELESRKAECDDLHWPRFHSEEMAALTDFVSKAKDRIGNFDDAN